MLDHDVYYKLADTVDCFNEIKKHNGGVTPIHPVSGKYIHAIVAVDREGY